MLKRRPIKWAELNCGLVVQSSTKELYGKFRYKMYINPRSKIIIMILSPIGIASTLELPLSLSLATPNR